jgi:glycosyltransferase involved in cell wall biosynthesis
LKVVFLNTDAHLGGAERSLLDLMSSLREAESSLGMHLVLGGTGPLEREARALGVRTHVLPLPPLLARLGDSAARGLAAKVKLAARAMSASLPTRRYVRELGRFLEGESPDIVHSNSIKFHFLSRLVRPRSAAVIWHLRDFPGSRPVMAHALRWASRGIIGVAISQAVAKDAHDTFGGSPFEVVYDGIDTRTFAPGLVDPNFLDALAGLATAGRPTVRVGLVAAFALGKGHEVFLEAAARLARPGLRFYVVGGPIYSTASQVLESDLRKRAERLSLGNRVAFTGFVENVADVYRALDVVVHAATRPEPFGRTIVEAMACGRATLVARTGGVVELISDGTDALGFEAGNAAALADRIDELARAPDLRARIGEAAHRSAVVRFSRQRLGPELLHIYARAREHSAARSPDTHAP